MQDGARIHTSNATMAFLDQVFGARVLSVRFFKCCSLVDFSQISISGLFKGRIGLPIVLI